MIRAAVIGATGIVGQQFVVALQRHPWFKIVHLAASERSAGKRYREALRDQRGAFQWYCDEAPDSAVLDMPVVDASALEGTEADVYFSGLETEAARELEPRYARHAAVVSTARAFRDEPDVPVLIPGVNSDHLHLVERQQKQRGWKGYIVTQPNCTATGMAITLKPIMDRFGVDQVLMTSLQALSGAGRAGGVLGLDILDNVIPFIPNEEERVEIESRKILGRLGEGAIQPADIRVSATCTRVNVRDGHTEAVYVSTRKPASVEEVRQAMEEYAVSLQPLGLPSAPDHLILVSDDPFRPQPRLDRTAEDGMATVVGRLRRDGALANGIKYVLLSHNTKMGAAKGAVLMAELLKKDGFLRGD
ncbi:MAG: aspartate-semialdehyde dehydrogenase [Chloroflexi bacterium]|nr:aspartate-semialdehyde dehydrogenase [Chloroflexota bacterium]